MTWAPASPAPVAVTTDPTAVIGRRIAAYIIDTFLALALVAIVAVPLFFAFSSTHAVDDPHFCDNLSRSGDDRVCMQIDDTHIRIFEDAAFGGFLLLAGGVAVLASLNQWVLQGVTGATVGKHMLGLRVVRADGAIAGFGWNALRTLLLIVDAACAGLVGLVTVLVSHPHQRVGDFAARTYVVARASVGRPVVAPPPGWSAYPPPAPVGWPSGPVPPPAPPAPVPVPPPPQPPQPQWDPARNAWIVWDPARGQWLQWDAVRAQWHAI